MATYSLLFIDAKSTSAEAGRSSVQPTSKPWIGPQRSQGISGPFRFGTETGLSF